MKNIITSYHHSFAGGSKNTSRLLHYLSLKGYKIDSFFYELPKYFSYTKSVMSNYCLLEDDNVISHVVDYNKLSNFLMTEKITTLLDLNKNSTLFGANLFPYCNILLDAKYQTNSKLNDTNLILHPVGSDIWQIGIQMPSRVKWLLDNELVNYVLTYSDIFASEIKEFYNIDKKIYTLPPIYEKEKFSPLSVTKIRRRKSLLGFSDDMFIIHHHSSMRKIKCVEVVIDIAYKASESISKKTTLIMAGPIPNDLLPRLDFTTIKLHENFFSYKSCRGNLTILWAGYTEEVEYLIQISDVELNTSLHDSFNLSLMEAMACGVPVVTSNIVGIAPYIEKSNFGICFPTKRLNFRDLNKSIELLNKKAFFDIDFAVDAIIYIEKNKDYYFNQRYEMNEFIEREFSDEKVINEFSKFL